jgi:hypothetical protein
MNVPVPKQQQRSEAGSVARHSLSLMTALLQKSLALPANYVEKFCCLCAASSLSDSPFPAHADCKAWDPLRPWGNGTKFAPTGKVCRTDALALLVNWVLPHVLLYIV